MCQKCVDAVHQYFPDCNNAEIGNFLISATSFPYGSVNDIERELKEHREAGCQTFREAMARADEETIVAERSMADPRMAEIESAIDAFHDAVCAGVLDLSNDVKARLVEEKRANLVAAITAVIIPSEPIQDCRERLLEADLRNETKDSGESK